MFSAQFFNLHEDAFCIKPGPDRVLLGVFDGHGGPHTAQHVADNLPDRILAQDPAAAPRIFQQLDAELLDDFTNDHTFMHRRSAAWKDHARRVKAGCTALTADIDLVSRTLTVCNAGDCRLLVVSLATDPPTVKFQTKDLNTKSPDERARLVREHPGEPLEDMIVGNRLFGRLMTTRGFGDGYFKLPRATFTFAPGPSRKYIRALSSTEPKSHKLGLIDVYPSLFYAYWTPPYITAMPDVYTVALEQGDVVLLATDGLWDVVEPSDVAKLVAESLGAASAAAPPPTRSSDTKDPESGSIDASLPHPHNHAQFVLDAATRDSEPGDDITVLFYQVQ